MSTASVKCLQCGLTNFATNEQCKRCGASLSQSADATKPQVEPVRGVLSPNNPSLTPCPDCGFHHSRNAEACPQCGRFIQRIELPERAKSASLSGVLAAFLFIIGIILGLAGLITVYSPSSIVGGDAYNYIIATGRGTALICAGCGLLILAAALDIRSEIIKSRRY
jgi:hypothetical protein